LSFSFRADNPGWYFAHCHVLMHNMGGMAFALRIGRRDEMPAPPPNFPLGCGIYEPPPPKKRNPSIEEKPHFISW
jgi:hypothetical protein